MTVLVTGAGGFLGRAVVNDLLRSGCRIRALVRDASHISSFPSTIEVLVGDIRDLQCAKAAARGCESVVHLAGKAHAIDDDSISDDEYQSVNVDGTKHLLEGAVAGGIRRFIFASSVKVFGETTACCVDEHARPAPHTPYARSKWLAEQAVASYSKSAAMSSVSFRLPLVYGLTQKGNLFRMIAAIDQGRFPPLPRISTVRSMLSINNFLLAVRAATRAEVFLKPMYIVTDAQPYSITDIYDLLRAGLGKKPPRWRSPLWALSFAAACGDLLEGLCNRRMPFSRSTFEKLIGPAWYSPEAFIRDIGYKPHDDFYTAVPELIAHYRKIMGLCG